MSTEEDTIFTNSPTLTEDDFRVMLHNYIETVKFEKQDGTIREMTCTTNLGCIPKEHHPKGSNKNFENSDVLRVYDLDLEEWRSFRFSSIISGNGRHIQPDDIVNPEYFDH